MSMQGQVVLVTGAATGIGAATILAMAAEGAAVAAADIVEERARETAERAAEAHRVAAIGIGVDVRETDSIDAMVTRTVAELGRLDAIVNCAGVTRAAYIMDLTPEDWDSMHSVNARGVFFCMQRAAREMIGQGGGRIVNIASIAGRGFQHTSNAAYAASKGAVISMTWTAAQQLGRHNINVNAICPGVTLTPMVERIVADRARQQNVSVEEARGSLARGIPIGRANEPEDIAAMAVFLCSAAARNVTGQAYNVDGGLVTS
jgi:NAD(P)-dependent dehydrogenase (short-subunit alcohol dehydrogenase family)